MAQVQGHTSGRVVYLTASVCVCHDAQDVLPALEELLGARDRCRQYLQGLMTLHAALTKAARYSGWVVMIAAGIMHSRVLAGISAVKAAWYAGGQAVAGLMSTYHGRMTMLQSRPPSWVSTQHGIVRSHRSCMSSCLPCPSGPSSLSLRRALLVTAARHRWWTALCTPSQPPPCPTCAACSHTQTWAR
jgi:hypothetical protein